MFGLHLRAGAGLAGLGLAAALLLAVPRSVGAVATTFTVTNTNDSGPGSLRQAILDANDNPGADTIEFSIGSGAQTITPLAPLPEVAGPVTVDGTTQPGYAGAPLVELDGTSAGAAVHGLVVSGTGATVRSLVINRFTQIGLVFFGSGHTVTGCYIGTNAAGTAASANVRIGVLLWGATNCTVGGTTAAARNVISGHGEQGILGSNGGGGHVIQGNYIGTNAAGTAAIPNAREGIRLDISGNQVGGAAPGAGNLVSGNTADGVAMYGTLNSALGNRIGTNAAGDAAIPNLVGVSCSGSSNTVGGAAAGAGNLISGNRWVGVLMANGANHSAIQGNWIGTDATGSSALGNADHGIYLSAADNNEIAGNVVSASGFNGIALGDGTTATRVTGNRVGTDADGLQAVPNGTGILVANASGNVIGGTTPADRNLVSGNSFGIYLYAAGTNGTRVEGNYVGTDVTGAAPLPNAANGVVVENAANNTIGGLASGAGNVISGNTAAGLALLGPGATGNLVQGNRIGVAATGTVALGNGWMGVWLGYGPSGNTIGGTSGGAGNVVAFSGDVGVRPADGVRNAVLGNSIHSNAAIGIDLGVDGVSPNDPGDPDTGANNLQNYPVLTTAYTSGGSTTVKGSLDSTPGTQFRVEFFSSPTADPSGHGEGERYLGSTLVTTGVSGTVNFQAAVPVLVAGGHRVTATATDPNGNTSEFSATIACSGPAETTPPSVTLTSTGINGSGKTYIQITVRDTGSGLASITVTDTTNCSTVVQPFTPGTTDAVLVTATKIDQSKSGRVALRAVDCLGNITNGDPVIANLELKKGKQLTRSFSGLPAAEHYVTLRNGTPGLREVIIRVNGKRFPLELADGESRTLDVASAVRHGRPNNFQITARGPRGATALLLIGDETMAGPSGPAPGGVARGVNFEWGR
ncbi:MAG: repeat-containing protein [Armatimonadetes bacterium]|nr:repeat-containing protein [Armatimonadota bacterium]